MGIATPVLRPWGLRLAAVLVMVGCASRSPSPPRGDVEEGPCRTDAECPSAHKCVHDRAHLRQADQITGDLVTFRCEPDGEPCRRQRLAFEQQAERSRSQPCEAPSECAAICGPRGGCPDENVVVNHADAEALTEMARKVREACGEAAVLDPAAGYSEIEAVCVANRCEPLRTSVAPMDESL